ncbi:serine/threonine protein kinase [Corallococcus coralloides]|nr:serine/threonine protein kinase [Corallococcus coralloides]
MPSAEPTISGRKRPPDPISGYRLVKLLGTGGMGAVHMATQLSLSRTVAIKMLNAELAKDPSFVARFQKEAAALATLNHPNVVTILDKGKTDTTYYLVMEFVDGPSLRDAIREKSLDTQSLLRRVMDICRAIEYAHERGVIHRDLKPENILLAKQAGGIAKVADFGVASFLSDTQAAALFALTASDVSMGTASYMAPEQWVDAKRADTRADIFSLGVILYEALTGRVPVGAFDPPSRKHAGLDPGVDTIVMRCLKPKPEERYQTMSALISDLEPLVPGSRPPEMTRRRQAEVAMRRAARVTALTLAGLTGLAAMCVLGVAYHRSGLVRAQQLLPGKAIMEESAGAKTIKGPGRVEDITPVKRRVTVGDGPDLPQMLVAGRPLSFENKTLVFPPVDDNEASRAGRARVDVMGLVGGVARLTARVRAEPPPTTWKRRLKEVWDGPPPEPVAALGLMGRDGRYVTLVHRGAGAPLSLEWALGERSGALQGLASPENEVRLELFVTEDGVMEAFVGQGKDLRPIAAPLNLGPDWQKSSFGEVPVPTFGCINGTCTVEGLTYTVDRSTPVAPMSEVNTLEPEVETRRPLDTAREGMVRRIMEATTPAPARRVQPTRLGAPYP